MAQKPALGKGLASLLPSASSAVAPGALLAGSSVGASSPQEGASRDRHLGISMASVDDIQANCFQPRKEFDESALQELAQSIETSGLIQPLVVRKSSKAGYELIAGERRLRAAKMAGLKQVPIVIRRSTDKESLELALIENIQRQDLNCMDEALAYAQLIQEFSLTQESVAYRVGKDRATVANYLRLLKLPETIKDDLKSKVLSFGHGKALLGIEDPEMRIRARALILEKHLSVRETEALVEAMKSHVDPSKQFVKTDPGKGALATRLANLSLELGRQWSTRIEIQGSEKRGKIVIHYSTRQELDRILEEMQTDKV